MLLVCTKGVSLYVCLDLLPSCVHVQSLNFLRMSARVDGVASRVQSAIQMRQVRGARNGGSSFHWYSVTTVIPRLL